MLINKQLIAKKYTLYTLQNSNRLSISILSFGGIITNISVPDKDHRFENIVLGYNNPEVYLSEAYINNCPYFGATIGRYANRIAKGEFKIGNKRFQLPINNGENHLHGGVKGFDKVSWDAEEIYEEGAVGIKLSYLSKDGEEGYPGNLHVTATYRLTNLDTLQVIFEANTDKATPVNLANHSYFNLSGGKSNILNHELFINANKFTVADHNNIPTGKLANIVGTALDFTESKAIGKDLNKDWTGYDHNFVLNAKPESFSLAAELFEPESRRKVVISTTKPGLQIYTANHFNGDIPPNGSCYFKKYSGIAIETQHFPDSPNHKNFPTTILVPGKKYIHRTDFKFLVD